MRLLLGLVAVAAAASTTLQQDVIDQNSCDAAGQNEVHLGMCECEKDCCNTPAEQLEDGCPIDVVLAIDMCSCNNQTWAHMRTFTTDLVNALNSDFGINDNDNSARLHVFQFMENTKDVVGFETFTKSEVEKKVLRMGVAEFHGKSTNIKTAIEHAEQVLENSPRANLPGRKTVFAIITNGYSDDALTKGDQNVFEAAVGMSSNPMDIRMVFVAREDSSMNAHTNEEIANTFHARERLHDPVAAQQIAGDIECDEAPEINYQRECKCTCDVPMGCHGIQGPAGLPGAPGGNGKRGDDGKKGNPGEMGKPGPDGEEGEEGGCGMPGEAGQKGEPGLDGNNGMSGAPGPVGIKGVPGEPGAAGAKGQQGDQGPDGEPGQPGVQGEPGPAGDQGEPGPEGQLDEKTLKWLVNKIFIEELNALDLQPPQT